MSTLLEVKHLKKYFPTPRGMLHAVDDVSFSIEGGKTLGVVGESGCGKSTLGRTIVHLLEPTEGQIIFEGEDISKPDKKKVAQLRQKMQFIFQDPYSSLNPKSVQAVRELAEDQQYIREQLPELGLVAFVSNGSVLPRKSGISIR